MCPLIIKYILNLEGSYGKPTVYFNIQRVSFLSGRCPVSHYCPNGSALPQVCDPGKYCSRPELSEPEFDCEAGYYCTSGAKQANPTDGVTGNICPKGTYCPRGSDAPENCPIGTYLNSTRNR